MRYGRGMPQPTRSRASLAALVLAGALATACRPADDQPAAPPDAPRVLVYTFTAAYRHPSIPAALEALHAIEAEAGFDVVYTEEPAAFEPNMADRFDVVVFANTTGTVLTDSGRHSLQEFIRSGGGFVGVHGASDTEHDWDWYAAMLGAEFTDHAPLPVDGTVVNEAPDFPATAHLPATLTYADEWYNFDRDPRPDSRVVLSLDETGIEGVTMGPGHPLAWARDFEGGRVFYTALGHTSEVWAQPWFRQHLRGAIEWAAAGRR